MEVLGARAEIVHRSESKRVAAAKESLRIFACSQFEVPAGTLCAREDPRASPSALVRIDSALDDDGDDLVWIRRADADTGRLAAARCLARVIAADPDGTLPDETALAMFDEIAPRESTPRPANNVAAATDWVPVVLLLDG